MRTVERERRYLCGLTKAKATRQDVEIYSYNPACQESRKRNKEMGQAPAFRGTPEPQANHNALAARKWFVRLVDTNFSGSDTHTTLTYSDKTLPQNDTQAQRDIDNFLRHLRRKCKAQGLPPPEALIVTESQTEDTEKQQKAVRVHHHAILRCGLSRDEIESCWHRNGVPLGYANADRLRKDKESLQALATYLTKYPKRKHRYKRTRGIKNPVMPAPRDDRYSRRQVERIAKDPSKLYSQEFWARKYPGWKLIEATANYNELLGWAISLRMYREPKPPKSQKKKE